MPIKFVPLSLGAQGISELTGGEWQASLSYRYLFADDGYLGTKKFPGYDNFPGNRITINSVDLQVTYAFTPRYSVSLTAPFLHGTISDKVSHNGVRHTTEADGMGDLWLVGNAWLLDPGEYRDGNISLGLGIKAPTGNWAATDTFYKSTGPQKRAVAVPIQPGDGGWGAPVELLAYQKVYSRLYGYLSGFYLFNPRNRNGTLTPFPLYGEFQKNSVPDQYQGRGGFSYIVWPEQQLSASFGVRIDGIPPNDAIGGSAGFRLPGYSLDVEPGVSWTYGKNTLNIFVPVLVQADKQSSPLDNQNNSPGPPAAFADWVMIASYSRRF